MIRISEKGLTLIELLIALAIMGLIASAGTALLSASLQAHEHGDARSGLYQEGLLAIERMTGGVRACTFLLIPNAYTPVRDILAFSGSVNEDNDFYFDDPLFPRIDEDLGADMSLNNKSGIEMVDDDGDGMIDEGGVVDDDEDGLNDEDQLDGLDNDSDGNFDEDFANDNNADGEPGIAYMDDDGDGSIDEGIAKDDDEDGSFEEDPINAIIYSIVSGTSTLQASMPYNGQTTVLSTRIASFQVTCETPERILIELTLTGDDGESVTFSEYVCPRNTFQKTGKRAR